MIELGQKSHEPSRWRTLLTFCLVAQHAFLNLALRRQQREPDRFRTVTPCFTGVVLVLSLLLAKIDRDMGTRHELARYVWPFNKEPH